MSSHTPDLVIECIGHRFQTTVPESDTCRTQLVPCFARAGHIFGLLKMADKLFLMPFLNVLSLKY